MRVYNEFFEFSNNVSIMAGDDGLSFATKRLYNLGANRVFVIVDGEIAKSNILKVVKNALENLEIEDGDKKEKLMVVGKVFSDINSIASTSMLSKAYSQYKTSGCDSIVGVGGIRAISIAKALNLLISTNSKDIRDFRGVDAAIKKHNIPFVLIPTEFGTGGEVSRSLVLVDDEKKKAIEIVSDVVQPQLCVLYPQFLKELPEEKLYLNLIDVLAYNIDSFVSLKANQITKSLNKSSIFLIKSNFKAAILNKDIDALFNLQRAAIIAGISYSNTFSGLIRTMAYAISSEYGISHAVAVCCVFKSCMEYYKETCAKEYSQILLYALGAKDFAANSELDRSQALVNIFSNITNVISNEFNIGTTLSDYGVKEEDIEEIAIKAMNDGALLGVPKRPTKEDIVSILKKSLIKEEEVEVAQND